MQKRSGSVIRTCLQRKNLEEAYSNNVRSMDSEEKHVIKYKRERDDLEHDIETIKETIILT